MLEFIKLDGNDFMGYFMWLKKININKNWKKKNLISNKKNFYE